VLLPIAAGYFCCLESLDDDVPDLPSGFIPESDFILPLGAFVSDDCVELVLGDAAGLLLLDGAADVFASTPSFADVSASSRPVAFRPCFCW